MATADPPYLRIVAEIRRRIAAGELAPGDRVPSTRQIAREWGVALATATKALTALNAEGLVHAKPRAGTVVAARESPATAPSRPRSGWSDHELTRERIVRAAVEIADSEGMAALSMRGIAARLGVAAMSPYRYVTSKEELILLMADAAYGEEGYPEQPVGGWREQVELSARTLWALHRRHPWLAQLSPLTRPLPLPNLLVHGEWLLRAVDGHGLDPGAMLDVEVLIYSYVQGIAVNLEREAQAQAATGVSGEQWVDNQQPALTAMAASGRYPTFAKVLQSFATDGYDLDLDELFELGLQFLLDGLAVRLEGDRSAHAAKGFHA
ncbi:TetR/AcrR family transcriptional regulator C-terminal domain-containing protein [Actinopolymorpha alba]|uniref:TetR/AcrR family transcriptional regulator C-terminal domain-containing protein n=1 Tax=Actinopolymorpha alba TaxID=533267 RepID=UPI00035FE8AF|nr:TetR/AcrR family transcriptional regulator C-terminal domain-containing protein [Actinopolymorpha alba]